MNTALGPLAAAKQTPGSDGFRAAMKKIRKRRLFLWVMIIVYMPAMWATLQLTQSYRATAGAFVIWVILLFVVATVAAVARCPGCGNYFHMNGMTLLFMRRCLHCGLHISADKKQAGISQDCSTDVSHDQPKQDDAA
jgi:hypothetical protein